MATRGEIWIHGGLERTGTTTLQRDQFTRLRGVNFMGKSRALYHLVNFGEAARLAEARAEVDARLDDRPALISHEGLFGGYTAQLELLRDAFPDASLIFTLRNQYERIFSLYKRTVQSGGVIGLLPFRSYVRTFRRSLVMANSYHEMVRAAMRLFDGRVHVFCMEDYRGDFDTLGAEMAALLGGGLEAQSGEPLPPRNVSLRAAHRTPMRQYCMLAARNMKLAKRFYPFSARLDGLLARLLRVDPAAEARAARQVLEPYFAPGNRRLEELLGRPLPPEYHPAGDRPRLGAG